MKNFEAKNVILFTHDDLDGAGCRIVFERFCKCHDIQFKVVNSHNNTIDKDVVNFLKFNDANYHTVYFADICASKSVLKDTVDAGYDVYVFDHHKTNEFALDVEGVSGIINAGTYTGQLESGASILYDWFTEEYDREFGGRLLYRLQDAIRSYDTWEWKDTINAELAKNAKRLNMLFHLLGMEKFCDMYIGVLNTRCSELDDVIPNPLLLDLVDSQIEKEAEDIKKFVSDAKFAEIDIRGYKSALILSISGISISDASNEWLKAHQEYDILAVFLPQYGSMSFRTIRDDIDLGTEICKPLGGGGHPKAAGAPLDPTKINTIYKLLEEAINK